MNRYDWILCERSQRWAAALRLALTRQSPQYRPRRLYETRKLADLLAKLHTRPDSLVLIEVTRSNYADVLDFLAQTAPQFPAARFAALLDSQFDSTRRRRSHLSPQNRPETLDALAEAGASGFAISPRQLAAILDLARRHASRLAARSTGPNNQPFAAWAMSLLPWQDD